MRAAVKWINQRTKHPDGGRVYAGQKPSLIVVDDEGKQCICVIVGYPVRTTLRPLDEIEVTRNVQGSPEKGVVTTEPAPAYKVPDAVKTILDIGKRCGITEAAKQVLKLIAADKAPSLDDVPDDEDLFINPFEGTAVPKEVSSMMTETNESAVSAAVSTSSAKKQAKGGSQKAKTKSKGKGATQAAGKKKAGKAASSGAKRASAAPSDGLGRPGTLSRFIAERLVKGQDPATISQAAKKAFPKSASTEPSHVSWLRWKLTSTGVLKGEKKVTAKKATKKK